jgi:two-component system, NtrC family, sensor kinase
MSSTGEQARRSRTVAQRLLSSFLVVLTAFAITVGWSLSAMREAAREAKLVRGAYVPLLLTIGEALAGQNVMNTQLNHITSAKNPADVRQWIQTARRVRPLIFARLRDEAAQGLLPELDARGLRAQVEAELDALEAQLAGGAPQYEKLFAALEGGDRAAAERLRDQLVATETDAAARLRNLRQRVDSAMTALTEAAEQREGRSFQLLIGLSLLTMIVGLVTSLYARRVLAPLTQVTERARAVAAGDLRPRDVVATKDEIGELAATFEDMVAAIRKARAELVRAERLATIGKMAAHITHEVRNPLSSIGLNLELLEEELSEADDGEPKQLLGAIQGEVERLSRIAEQYLAVAREPQLTLSRESVEDLLRECHAFVKPELERAGLKSNVEVEPNLPLVDIDETQLRQALVNLIRNAREALPKGGHIRLSVSLHDGVLTIDVEDDGPGVPDAVRPSIFDPFYTTKRHGTGLGLAVTRSIVEAHGGKITCEPRAGGGTRFRISLPAHSDAAQAKVASAPKKAAPHQAEARKEPRAASDSESLDEVSESMD